jgi:hypothetical protein
MTGVATPSALPALRRRFWIRRNARSRCMLLFTTRPSPAHSNYVELYGSPQVVLAKKSAGMPSDAPLLSTLALVEALLGDRDAQAIQDGERAAKMLPISKDALRGPDVLSNLAVVYAWCGKLDKPSTSSPCWLSRRMEFTMGI